MQSLRARGLSPSDRGHGEGRVTLLPSLAPQLPGPGTLHPCPLPPPLPHLRGAQVSACPPPNASRLRVDQRGRLPGQLGAPLNPRKGPGSRGPGGRRSLSGLSLAAQCVSSVPHPWGRATLGSGVPGGSGRDGGGHLRGGPFRGRQGRARPRKESGTAVRAACPVAASRRGPACWPRGSLPLSLPSPCFNLLQTPQLKPSPALVQPLGRCHPGDEQRVQGALQAPPS